MDPYEIKIKNYLEMGEILQGWARNADTVPATVGDFRAQVPSNVAELADEFKDEDPLQIFNAPDQKVVSIMLPHPDDLDLPPPSPYTLPDFYDEAYDATLVTPPEEEHNFRSKRIADYALRKCV